MKISVGQAIPQIETALKANLVPMIVGDPGIGKSEIVLAIAEKYGLFVIDQRLSQCDPTDLNGFPTVVNGVASYVPMDIWPTEDKYPLDANDQVTVKGQKYNGFLLFLDELNSAPMAVQAASYKLILDRKVGQHPLHPRTKIVGAGNLETNNAIVNRLSTAMQSRLVHMELEPDSKSWLDWATTVGIDHRVTSYIGNRPENLHKFDLQHNDRTFACPRTWAFASKILKAHNGKAKDIIPLLAGTLSEGVAREFVTHLELCVDLPSFDEILQQPLAVDIKMDPAMLYAITHMVANKVDPTTIAQAMLFIGRLPVEFATITLQIAVRRNPPIIHTKEVKDWISLRGAELF